MKLLSKVKIFSLCMSFFAPIAVYGNDPLLVMKKGDLLGLELSLPVSYQKPVSDIVSTDELTKKILTDSESLWPQSEETNFQGNLSDLEEVLTNKFPFRFFNICACMPEGAYISFAQLVVDQAILLYLKKDPKKPFIYGSFASGGLFPDLYILTKFVKELQDRKVKNIHLQVNLIDTDLRDYIWQHSSGLGRMTMVDEPVHAHMLYFKSTMGLEFSNADDSSDLIIKFLQWFTQNLKIKLDLYVYGTGQNYVYDHEKHRVLSHDMLVAMDYYPQSQGDLAQLALRTIKKDGYLCSLDNKAPQETFFEEGLVSPSSYKELALLIQKEADELEALEAEAREDEITEEAITEDDEGPADLPVYITISQKKANISTETFKNLLQQARGDNIKIGRLLNPLLYPESKILMFQSQKLQKYLKFNPLDYFSVKYATVTNVIDEQAEMMLQPRFDPVAQKEELSAQLSKIITVVKGVKRATL